MKKRADVYDAIKMCYMGGAQKQHLRVIGS